MNLMKLKRNKEIFYINYYFKKMILNNNRN